MNILRLTQRTLSTDEYSVELALEGPNMVRQTAVSTFSFELSPQEQENIRWYLENFLETPHDPTPKIAANIEQKIAEIGRPLFRNVFQASDDTRDLWAMVRARLNDFRVEIATEVEEATSVPWELIRDPKLDTPLAL